MGRVLDQILASRASAAAALAAAVLLLAALLFPGPARADFGIASFTSAATNQNGSADLLAGSHPFAYTFELATNTDAEGNPEGSLGSLDVDLPPGLVGNPLAVPRCTRANFDSGTSNCQPGAQVGVLSAFATGLGGSVVAPVFNLVPPPGYVASFGVNAQGKTTIEGLVLEGSGAGAHLRVTTLFMSPGLGIKQVTQTIWGVPADPGHDGQRGACLEAGGTCRAETAPAPLLSLPTSCGVPLTTTLSVRSQEEPERNLTTTFTAREPGGAPLRLVGCASLPFVPDFALGTEGAAQAPTGLRVDLSLPTDEPAYGRSAATLGRLTAQLPPGLALNPSAAAGLVGCAPDESPCPAFSKLGTASAELPSIDHPLNGGVYLAEPGQNPFGSLFAVYVVLDDPATGTLIKLPAQLDADPSDGRLEMKVDGMPQLPFGHVELEFAGGPRALFATPPTCGGFAAFADFVPSSAPEGAIVHLSSTFTLDRGPAFGPCPSPSLPNDPSLEAGTVEAVAGSQTPFVLRLQRNDGSQRLARFDIGLPPGIAARLAGTATCGEAAMPACPASAAVGSATVGTGVGPSPLYLHGTVYLAGPYSGAPFSLLVVVPAQAGPFDLGTIAVRAAVRVDPTTGRVSVASDPLPQILDGVPLAIRSLALSLDRPGFIRNPTSCEPMAIDAAMSSTLGQVAPLSTSFQVGDCAALGFGPRLSVRMLGPAVRGAHPRIRATLRPRRGSADIEAVSIDLPGSELLDAKRIGAVCAMPAAEIEACPAASVVARIEVHTPLLAEPLSGRVFLRPSQMRLPGLTAVLDGAIQLRLSGSLGSVGGRVRLGFGDLPDLPFDSLTLQVAGGRRGILVNSGGVCRGSRRLDAVLKAHNGRVRRVSPRLDAPCSGRGRPRQ